MSNQDSISNRDRKLESNYNNVRQIISNFFYKNYEFFLIIRLIKM